MSKLKLKDNIYYIGVKDAELRVFDIIMETKKGTTYNSYLIDDEKIAIVDTVKDGYFDEFISNIKEIIGDKPVDYIVVQHTELDHSGSLGRLLEVYPEATVVASRAALTYCKQIINKEFKSKDAIEALCLGKTTLQFISAPNLHWPDTMFTYAKEAKLLFTCDVMGCHYCPENDVTDECTGDYFDEMKYYFDVIMGPFKKFVIMGLDKISNLEFDMVAPSHGPVHISDNKKYIELYREWSKLATIEEKNILVMYVSAYGNTGKMAEYMCEKIIDKGIKAKVYEILPENIGEIVSKIELASGILVGSPTINQDAVKPVWDVLSQVCPITNRNKVAAAFGSFGWSGESVPMMTERLKSLKFKTIEGGLKFNFVPSDEDYKKADELVEKLVEQL